MRYAVISDIHGKVHALEAVLKDIERQVPDHIFCLGDLVGYGAFPGECIALVKESCSVILKGNHDAAAGAGGSLDGYFEDARLSLEWTRERLSEAEREFLQALPLTHAGEITSYVHASLHEPAEWDYLDTEEALDLHFERQESDLCFAGHTHLPAIIGGAELACANLSWNVPLPLPRDQKILINPGAVGQPRDEDPRACYAIFDEAQRIVTYRRVRYEVRRAQNGIRAIKMPTFLADRLENGV